MARPGDLEVEAKLRLADPTAARERLLALGARPLGVTLEDDRYFLHPSRDLAAGDEALRLRRSQLLGAEGQGTGPLAFELTYKGPRLSSGVKARTELTLSTAQDPTMLLLALGFGLGPRVRKRRESHELDGLTVTLDDVEGLGWHAEVEAMAPDAAQGQALVEGVLRRLGWLALPREERPYVEMVAGR